MLTEALRSTQDLKLTACIMYVAFPSCWQVQHWWKQVVEFIHCPGILCASTAKSAKLTKKICH